MFLISSCSTITQSDLSNSEITRSFAEISKLENIQAKIIIDKLGVPHIISRGDVDMFFAQGYVHASLRLWQMETNSRIIESRLSEVLGQRGVDTDELVAHFGINEDALRAHDNIMKDSETKIAMEAYVRGVNARISQLTPKTWPAGYQRINLPPRLFTTQDVVRIVYLMAWTSSDPFEELRLTKTRSSMGEKKFAQLYPWPGTKSDYGVFGPGDLSTVSNGRFSPIAKDEVIALNYHKPWIDVLPNAGSNVILVPASRMDNDKPVLINDFHSAYRLPSAFLPMQLTSSQLNVVGSTTPGVLGIITGHNGKVIWGRVLAQADFSDWFRLKTNAKNQYFWKKKWHNFKSEKVTLKVLNSGDYQFSRQISVAGPMVPALKEGSASRMLLYRWAGRDIKNIIKPFIQQMKMRTATDCGNSELLQNMYWTIMACADSSSQMGAWATGIYPNRVSDHDPRVLNYAENDNHIWKEYFPTQKNPKSVQIKEPIVLANQQVLNKSDEPYIGWAFSPPDRLIRINHLLKDKIKISRSDIESISSDIISAKSLALYPIFMKMSEKFINKNKCENDVLVELKKWDMVYNANSHLPALFNTWIRHAEKKLWKSVIGDSNQYLWPNSWLFVEMMEGKKQLLQKEAQTSVREGLLSACQLFTASGKSIYDQKWSTYSHPVAFVTIPDMQHLLDNIYPSGSGTTVFTQGKSQGAVFRSMASFGEKNQYWSAFMGTVDEDSKDTEWIKAWSERRLKEIPFYEYGNMND